MLNNLSAPRVRTLGVVLAATWCLTACKKEEEPTYPPTIGEATITCGAATGQNAAPLETVGIELTDPDGDLFADSLEVTLNGVVITGFADDDVDDIYTWSPPSSWNPPAACHGIFQLIVRVRDAEGQVATKTIEIDKST